jgi:hypothetical protein
MNNEFPWQQQENVQPIDNRYIEKLEEYYKTISQCPTISIKSEAYCVGHAVGTFIKTNSIPLDDQFYAAVTEFRKRHGL